MSVVESLYTGYGEMAPRGKGPRPKVLNARGNKYLKTQFPDLDYIVSARIVE
jgi:peptidyl-prolyl cis-trans isomerase A (cyclophilin A)